MTSRAMTFTVRVPPELVDRLNLITETTDRSKAYVGVQALREYITREADFIESVKEGLAEAERGEFASDEQVAATFAKYGVSVKRKPRK